MNNVLKKVALAAALAAAGFSAVAAPIVGKTFVNIGTVAISFGEIDWLGVNPGPAPMGSPTFGQFTSINTGNNTGSFAAMPLASSGQIQDMSLNPFDGNYVPIGANSISNFLQFGFNPAWQFNMNFLAPGTEGPYSLLQAGQNVTATISFNGTACDMATTGLATICDPTDSLTGWTGVFAATYTNITVAQLIFDVVNGNPVQLAGYTGTIIADNIVPEPGSLALLGLGLVGLAAARRRKSA